MRSLCLKSSKKGTPISVHFHSHRGSSPVFGKNKRQKPIEDINVQPSNCSSSNWFEKKNDPRASHETHKKEPLC